MERDSAPVYRSLLEGNAGDNGFGFDTEELSGYLSENLDARRSHSKAQTRLEVPGRVSDRSEEHTSELQSRPHLVCRLLLEKKNTLRHNLAPQIDHDTDPLGTG